MRPYVIWSFEHDGWWKPGGWGYTTALNEAGHYSQTEAERIVRDANVVTLEEKMLTIEEAAAFHPPPSFSCPRCRRRSFNLNDVREQYCGHCHVFRDEGDGRRR